MAYIEELQNKLLEYFKQGTSNLYPAEYLGLSQDDYSVVFDLIWTPEFRFKLWSQKFIDKHEDTPTLEEAYVTGYKDGGLIDNFSESLLVSVAAHLYSLTNYCRSKSRAWHCQYFVSQYIKYKDEPDSPIKLHYLTKYINMAKCIVNTEALDWFSDEIIGDE